MTREVERYLWGEFRYDRLAQIKAEYDPKNVFNKLFAITPPATS